MRRIKWAICVLGVVGVFGNAQAEKDVRKTKAEPKIEVATGDGSTSVDQPKPKAEEKPSGKK